MPIEIIIKKEKYNYRTVPHDKPYVVDQERLNGIQTLQDVKLFKAPKSIITTINRAGEIVKEKVKFKASATGEAPRTLVGAKILKHIQEMTPTHNNVVELEDGYIDRSKADLAVGDPEVEKALMKSFRAVVTLKKAGSAMDRQLKQAHKVITD